QIMAFGNPIQMRHGLAAAIALVSVVSLAEAAEPPKLTLVVCSPGSPGTTEEAQPRMDELASAVTAKSGTAVAAGYEPSDAAGASHLRSAEAGLVSLPFFLQHEQEVGLRAPLHAGGKGPAP